MPNHALPLVRAAIYARVSSDEQREGQTIDSQVAELERFARAQGWLIAGIYKDEGWSGAVLARPELDRLRDDASRKEFALVLINDVDRLARDVSHLGVIKRDLEKRGVQVQFRKLPAEQSPTANLMVNILGSFAEFERELITDRTRRGRRHKVEVRQQFLGSLAPYGYRYVTKDQSGSKSGHLELIAEHAAIVRQLFAWVGEEGYSTRKAVKQLNELGVPPPKGGKAWAKSSVTRILRCETYTGVWHYNKSESYAPPAQGKSDYRRVVKYKNRPRAREEWIAVPLGQDLQIVTRKEWEQAQAQLARNRSFSKRNAQHFYLLRGLVQCGGCQARYVGDPNHGKYYYRCYQRCKQLPAVREEALNEAVWEAVKEMTLQPQLILKQVAQQERAMTARMAQYKSEAGQAEQALAKIEDEEKRIVEAYRLNILTPELLARELGQLGARRGLLLERKAAMDGIRQKVHAATVKKSVLDYCREASQRLATFTEPERQRFLQLLIEAVVFKGQEIVIRGVIPLHTQAAAAESESAANQGDDFAADRIAAMGSYGQSHNSVKQLPFEIAKSVFQREPFWSDDRLMLLREFIKRKPMATLQELCEWMKRDYGFSLSITEMSRARIRLGFRRNRYQPCGKGDGPTHHGRSLELH